MKERKYYHYVFVTYKNRYIIEGDIKEYLKRIFGEIAKRKNIKIISLAILSDHVHMLIEQKQNDLPAYIMKCFKGYSSYKLFHEPPNIDRLIYRKLWARSYYRREVSASELRIVDDYIKHQINKLGEDKRFINKTKWSRGV